MAVRVLLKLWSTNSSQTDAERGSQSSCEWRKEDRCEGHQKGDRGEHGDTSQTLSD